MNQAEEIILAFGTAERLKDEIMPEKPWTSTITNWAWRGNIPRWWRPEVLKAAERCGVELTPDQVDYLLS